MDKIVAAADALANIPVYWIGVFSGLAGVIIAQAVKVMLFERRRSQDVKVRLDDRYRAQYIEIYKMAREVDFALESLLSICLKKTNTSKREFIVLAYELLRNNALAFIDRLDWRQHDLIIYLPSDLEERCVRIRSSLFDALSSTTIQSNIQIRHFQNNGSKRYTPVDISQLGTWSRAGRIWPNILEFRRLDFVESSPFMDPKLVAAMRDDLKFVINYLKTVFTH